MTSSGDLWWLPTRSPLLRPQLRLQLRDLRPPPLLLPPPRRHRQLQGEREHRRQNGDQRHATNKRDVIECWRSVQDQVESGWTSGGSAAAGERVRGFSHGEALVEEGRWNGRGHQEKVKYFLLCRTLINHKVYCETHIERNKSVVFMDLRTDTQTAYHLYVPGKNSYMNWTTEIAVTN